MTEALLTLALITTLVLSYLERKDLYNRLMAKDLRDLKENTQRDEPNEELQEEDDGLEELSLDRILTEEKLNG